MRRLILAFLHPWRAGRTFSRPACASAWQVEVTSRSLRRAHYWASKAQSLPRPSQCLHQTWLLLLLLLPQPQQLRRRRWRLIGVPLVCVPRLLTTAGAAACMCRRKATVAVFALMAARICASRRARHTTTAGRCATRAKSPTLLVVVQLQVPAEMPTQSSQSPMCGSILVQSVI